MGAELFHADGQTDRTKLIVAFFFYFCERALKMKDSYGAGTSKRAVWRGSLRIEMEMWFYRRGIFLFKGHDNFV